jgi:carbonic anhydrase/acetyltransferase-like protein (isoleucine patch superfamily)
MMTIAHISSVAANLPLQELEKVKNSGRAYQGMTPKLGEKVVVGRGAVVMGEVEIGDDSSVWPLTVIRGDMHHVRIGQRTSVQDGSVLHITHASDFNPGGYPLIIGDDVTIGHQAMLHGCTIGNQVLIGMKAMVMDGVVIEDKVIVAAGALIPPGKTLESGYMYVGSPAKKARPLTEKELRFFPYTAANYVKLKDKHIAAGFAE